MGTWDTIDRDFIAAKMADMSPLELKVLAYVCSVQDGTVRMELMKHVIRCEKEKIALSTDDLRQIAETHWTLALENDGCGRGELPWKPKGGHSGGGANHLTEQIRRAHSLEGGLLVCYRCAAEDSHIAPDCRSGKVHCTICNEESHSTKAH